MGRRVGGSLVTKNLVRYEGLDGTSRYAMLETIREYAAAQLRASGETEIGRRHAEYYEALAIRADAAWWGLTPGGDWTMLDAEHGNMQAALAWAIEHDEADLALSIGAAAQPLWFSGGREPEGLQWLRRALAGGSAPAVRVRALTVAWWLAHILNYREEEAALATEALELARAHGDAAGIARATFALGVYTVIIGPPSEAVALLTEALAHFRALNESGRAAMTLCYLASLCSLDAVDEGGDAAALDRAVAYCEGALRLSRESGFRLGSRRALHGLAYATYKQRDFPRALALSQQVLSTSTAQPWSIAASWEDIADIAGRSGAPEQAARLYGAADAVRELFGMPVEATYRAEFDRDVAVSRRALGEAAFATAWAAGRRLTEAEATSEALSFSLETAPAPATSSPGLLTRRERDVLELLAAGLTDKAIAEALSIGDRTVETHLAHIYTKLGVRTRSAAVSAAIALNLVPPTPRS